MGSLTNPGLAYDQGQGTDPSSGMQVQLPPIVKYFKNAALRGHQAALDEMATVQPGTSTVSGPNGGAPQIPNPGEPDQNTATDNAPPRSSMPKIFKPSFAQTTTDAQGLPAPINPAQTKLGKLLTILGAAAHGAAAGWGTGNPAAGADRAREIPLQMAQQRQQLAQGQAQTELLKQQATMVQTPLGPMTAAMAKVVYPSLISAGAKTSSAQIGATSRENVQGMKGDTAENIQGQKSQTATDVAGINKRFMAVPGVGLLDTQDPSGKPSLIPGSAQGITLTQQHLNDYGLPQEFLGKTMTLQQLAQLERVQNQQTTTVQGASGPALVNKKTGKTTGLGLGNPAMGKPLQVGDVNNPGNTTFVTGQQAITQGLPGTQSASVQVPKAAAKSEVPTKIGDQKVAFNTAIQHADLLRTAVKALGNGDQQTLNGLKNRFANEFGATGPITAQVIADAYGREVTAMLSKGHMTDSEIATVGSTVNPLKQNFKQIDSVLNGYQALAKSKMTQLNAQKQSAIAQSQTQGKSASSAAFPQGATHIVPGPDGRNHYTNQAGTIDLGIAP